ncbi:oxidoreductase [Streptomyces chrestomyceticus JCM 4735]|uniref:Oxidoreductase n=1 Tax=Streptomyces chrestomyceticus JCM 4735 TaxID=1306181 RepID=A0A7U9KW52_9ACTN|nr:hypothetical protein [Streptomyces chrestomyceticus]GCD36510.1 oxidoreductase [Streptomyces chrestomyceticus JCM 4735]
MKAVIAGSSGNTTVTDTPDPSPTPTQVLIDVEAAGVGYVDVMTLRGEYPAFPGRGRCPGWRSSGG